MRIPCESVMENAPEKRRDRLQCILRREDVGEFKKIEEKNLNVEMMLLHDMISRIFFPRVGRFDFVLEKDVNVMYHILQEIPLNLPNLMIKDMEEAVGKSKAPLPYGMILTHVFRYFEVRFCG